MKVLVKIVAAILAVALVFGVISNAFASSVHDI